MDNLEPGSNAVALVSGGLDSVTLAHLLYNRGINLHLLWVDYGQRHKKEWAASMTCATHLGAQFTALNLQALGHELRGSALTDPSVAVPYGHYTDETMRATVVPNRNAVLLSIAFAIAVAEKADIVAAAMHAGDHAIYPDCRPAFTDAFQKMQDLATEGFSSPYLLTPFIDYTKAQIVADGAMLGVPFRETWSCYEGGAVHCGACGTCVERREAFELAGVKDPTVYKGDTTSAPTT